MFFPLQGRDYSAKGVQKKNRFTYECPTLNEQFYTIFTFRAFPVHHLTGRLLTALVYGASFNEDE